MSVSRSPAEGLHTHGGPGGVIGAASLLRLAGSGERVSSLLLPGAAAASLTAVVTWVIGRCAAGL